MDDIDIGELLELFENRLQNKLQEFKDDVKSGLSLCSIEIKNISNSIQDLNFKLLSLHEQLITLQKSQYLSEKEITKEITNIWSAIKKLKKEKEKDKWKQ